MITGAHFLIYSKDADADRAFLRDVLGFTGVDAGHGWLILALPPSEIAVHPGNGEFTQKTAEGEMLGCQLYLMCDDLEAAMRSLEQKKVRCGAVQKAPWGFHTTLRLPSGGDLGIYQPTHPTAIGLAR